MIETLYSPHESSGLLSYTNTKRKAPKSSTPPPKRKKTEAPSVTDDPERMYCLTKLEEIFQGMFLQHRHVHAENSGGNVEGEVENTLIDWPMDMLREEELSALAEVGKRFAADLEQAIFDFYCELDSSGDPHPGHEYKDQFRVLRFNLHTPDRIALHQRIAGGLLHPKEIAVMSSTDIASEEAKQFINQADQVALEHPIPIPATIARAEVAHRGLEDIAVVHGTLALQDKQSRLERERMARLKAQLTRTKFIHLPLDTFAIPQEPSLGRSSPRPLDVISLFTPVDMALSLLPVSPTTENPKIDLSDFINMSGNSVAELSHMQAAAADLWNLEGLISETQMQDTPLSPIINSLLPSFDSNSLRLRPQALHATPPEAHPSNLKGASSLNNSDKDMSINADQNHIFNLFTKDSLESVSKIAETQQAELDALPRVSACKISMSLGSTIYPDIPMVARQIGGNSIPPESGRWKALFPRDVLHIEALMPAESSANFLRQSRLANLKEFVAVAFAPENPENGVSFGALSEFLTADGRHGLVFPWGNRPKKHYPGHELYIIPLLSTEPVPDFLELLDDLRLPKLRKQHLLIGVWPLHKGKLTSPPPPTPTTRTSEPPSPRTPLNSLSPNHTPTDRVEGKKLRCATIKWLQTLIHDKDRYRTLLALKGGQAQIVVNVLQELLDSSDAQESTFRKEIIVTLQQLANKAQVFPSSYQINAEIVPDQDCFMGGGGFGEIFKCYHGGQAVCVKMIRLTAISQGERFMKQFVKEAIIWAQLSHPNIVPFQGFFYYSYRPCLLSPWLSNGHINDYLQSSSSPNRYLLVKDMTEGLRYLHSWGIVHGDLKGANVMVDDSGRARLTDFGISSIFDSALPHWTSLSTVASKGGSTRWQAPELFESNNNDQEVHNTIMSDVYAWGCTCYEIFTCKLPFYEIPKDFTVMLQVLRDGLRPSRPSDDDPAWLLWGLQQQFWKLMERCWANAPGERPFVEELLTIPLLTEAQDNRPSCAWTESSTQYRAARGTGEPTVSTEIEALECILSGDDVNI